MVTRCHGGPCPLPSPGDELLRSSSHRTLGRGYGAPCRATDSARLQAARGGPGPGDSGLYSTAHTRLGQCPWTWLSRPAWPGPTQAENERFLSGGRRNWTEGRQQWGILPDRYWWRGDMLSSVLTYHQADTGLSASHPSRRREHLSDAKY